MKTKQIGIESICIINKERATIACNIMFEGHVYDAPVYTNIFCNYGQLSDLLNINKSNLAKEIKNDIDTQLIISDSKVIQIDIPDYLVGQIEWNFETLVDLEVASEESIPFQCYAFAKSNL